VSSYYDVLLCPECNEETHLSRKDDAGTLWYECNKGHSTATPIKKRLNALSPSEAREYCNSDEKQAEPKKVRESQADRIVKLCLDDQVTLFCDQFSTPYVRIVEPLRCCDTCSVSECLLPALKNSKSQEMDDREEKFLKNRKHRNTARPEALTCLSGLGNLRFG
jgi:hypothetical protein